LDLASSTTRAGKGLLFNHWRGPRKAGTGFNFTHYFVSDWKGDSSPDLLVRDDQGNLLLYPFKNGSFDEGGGPINVRSGFNFTHYLLVGPDLLVRNDQGDLLLYPFKNGSYYEGGGPINVSNPFKFNFTHYIQASADPIVRNDQGDLLLCRFKNGTFNEGCGPIAGFSGGFNSAHYFVGRDWEPGFSYGLLVRNDPGNLLMYGFSPSVPGDPNGRLYRPHGAGTDFNYSHYLTGDWAGDFRSDLIGRNDQGDLVSRSVPALISPTISWVSGRQTKSFLTLLI
jgi:hypothetical protein